MSLPLVLNVEVITPPITLLVPFINEKQGTRKQAALTIAAPSNLGHERNCQLPSRFPF